LVEGFHAWQIDKLEVYRALEGKPPRYLDDQTIVAVASDQPAPYGLPPRLRWLDLNRPDTVLDWLIKKIPRQA